MNFAELVSSRRTIRRFEQRQLPDELIVQLIDAARYASCASNKQPLRYVVIREREAVRQVFETTRWAGMVAPKRTPEWGVDAPLCFIAVTIPAEMPLHLPADAGAAVQSMELAAWEKGVGCCWFASFDPQKTAQIIGLPPERKVLYLVAAGFPAETPVTEDAVDGNVAYYLDSQDVLHVPKLPVNEITSWM
ncbi:MAG: hypothetical protein E7058_03740 [Lentisphaerae bacterium]|nr:hypothetical protein [Lentisphaerota bacterium]